MRPIKFRAYNKTNKEIWNLNLLNEWFKFDNENYIILQFVWHKDKNWREIYEWDIVYCMSEIMPDWARFNKVVEWYDAAWAWSIWNKDSRETWEIIWNIYENPHLLK